MTNNLLHITGLHAAVREKETEILKGLELSINEGEVHVLMGPNGAGKSTLANIIMGHPAYEVTGGAIRFDGEDITRAATDERARKGIFLSFQTPEEIAGITVENFLRAAKSAVTGKQVGAYAFHKELKARMRELDMDESYGGRYLNVGFSGGEKKKNEIFQLLTLNPRLAILDETDSGLDVDAVKTVTDGINSYRNEHNAILLITHNTRVLERIAPDRVHVLVEGHIAKSGGRELIDTIAQNGFAGFEASVPALAR